MKSLPPISSIGALDPDLPGHDAAGLLADLDADVARAGERDEARLRALDEGVADRRAAAGQEVEDAVGHAGLLAGLEEHRRRCRRRRRRASGRRCCPRRARPSSCRRGSRAGSSTAGSRRRRRAEMWRSSLRSPGYGRQGLRQRRAAPSRGRRTRRNRSPRPCRRRPRPRTSTPRGPSSRRTRACGGGGSPRSGRGDRSSRGRNVLPRLECPRGRVDRALGVGARALGEAADDFGVFRRVERRELRRVLAPLAVDEERPRSGRRA